MASFRNNLVSQYQNVKPFWISLPQEMIEVVVMTTGTLKHVQTTAHATSAPVKSPASAHQHSDFFKVLPATSVTWDPIANLLCTAQTFRTSCHPFNNVEQKLH